MTDAGARRGPLADTRIVEIGSIGPGPFAAMMLADMGADVIRVDRAARDEGPLAGGTWDAMKRGRPSVGVDVKRPEGRDLVLRLCASADALLEGFRPGVMERLGLGPDDALESNPRLVYGRMTGYGQQGPMASVAGHDINYISLAGVLGGMQRTGERPMFPMNLIGDFGGGGMLLAFGVVCGILEARVSGRGQVVDAAMVDGSAVLSTLIHGLRAAGFWSDPPGTNFLDSGAHFYEVYETSDGGHIAVGAIEPQFYTELLRLLELDPDDFPQWDQKRWPQFKQRFAEVLATRTRAEWTEVLEPAEACATPVLGMAEAAEHPHNVQRQTFVAPDGLNQPAPAPRFSRTPGGISRPPSLPGSDTREALAAWGVAAPELEGLETAGVIAAPASARQPA